MTFYDAYRHILLKLSEKYDRQEADAITRILFEHVTSQTRADIIRNNDQPIAAEIMKKLIFALDRLSTMEPVQYITGEAFFCGRGFVVSPSVLIPRPETAQLVEMAVDFLSHKPSATVFEVGSGSGCISISMQLALHSLQISSMDISGEALEIAKRNAQKYDAVVDWMSGDFLDNSHWIKHGKYDLLVSNPPYIPQSELAQMNLNVTKYEPHLALFVADRDPLIFYRKIAEWGKTHLTKDGKIMVECHRDWTDACLELFVLEGYEGEIIKDMFNNNRFVSVSRCH